MLTRQVIADSLKCSPHDSVDEAKEVELLFTTFDEIDGLDVTPRLERLCLIDNGLKRVNNLEVVSRTLRSLTICDQPLTAIDENSFCLPVLRELHLHRNNLKNVSGLTGCPQVRKLWIFQNQLESLNGVQALPGLEELWAQSNDIKSLDGIQYCRGMANLGLAGNPISDFREIRKLKALPNLKSLSMNDVHFGRCPLTFEPTYKDFVITALKQLSLLDDIHITKEVVQSAASAFHKEINTFQAALKTVGSGFSETIDSIDAEFKGKERYSSSLEREMATAMHDLEHLVFQNRKSVLGQVQSHKSLAEENMFSLRKRLESLIRDITDNYSRSGAHIGNKLRVSSSLTLLLQTIGRTEAILLGILCGGGDDKQKELKADVMFQPIASNSPDFQVLSKQVSGIPSNIPFISPIEMISAFRCIRRRRIVDRKYSKEQVEYYSNNSDSHKRKPFTSDARVTNNVSRVALDEPNNLVEDRVTVYTVVRMTELRKLVCGDWMKAGVDNSNYIFSTSSTLAADIHRGTEEEEEEEEEEKDVSKSLDPINFQDLADTEVVGATMNRLESTRKGPFQVNGASHTGEDFESSKNVPSQCFLLIKCSMKSKHPALKCSSVEVYPSTDHGHQQFVQRFCDANMTVSIESSSPMKVLSLPCKDCQNDVLLDSICVCLTSHVSDGSMIGLRGISSRLELLLHDLQGDTSKSSSSSQDAGRFGFYHRQAEHVFRTHVDRLLEEVTGNEASNYFTAEKNVRTRQSHVGSVEIDIERERHKHESLLRSMRHAIPQVQSKV